MRFLAPPPAAARARPHRQTPRGDDRLAAARRAARAGQRGRRRPTEPPSPADLPQPELGCQHFEACSGCTLSAGLDAPPLLQDAQSYFQQHGLEKFQLDAGPVQHWRHRARLAVQPGPGLGGRPAVIGLFRQGTHEAVDVPHCVAHHPAINAAVQLVRSCIEASGISAYEEATGRGELRYLQFTVINGVAAPAAGPAPTSPAPAPSVQVVLVWNAEACGTQVPRRLQQLADCIWRLTGQLEPGRGPPAPQQRRQQRRRQWPGLVHSVWANFQPARTNTILGPEWRLLQGPELAWARLGGADICFGPGSFLQVNFEAMDRCLRAMQRFVPPGAGIVDLHAGVGTIGLSLAATRQPRWVRCVEINPLAEGPFRRSAVRLAESWGALAAAESSSGGSAEGRGEGGRAAGELRQQGGGPGLHQSQPPLLEYHVAAAGSDPGRWLAGADVAIVDPPRKGLEPQLLQFLSSPAALSSLPELRRLLYLSCGFPALQRDCDALLGSGQWRLAHARAFLFFPGTNHIETLVVLERCNT